MLDALAPRTGEDLLGARAGRDDGLPVRLERSHLPAYFRAIAVRLRGCMR